MQKWKAVTQKVFLHIGFCHLYTFARYVLRKYTGTQLETGKCLMTTLYCIHKKHQCKIVFPSLFLMGEPGPGRRKQTSYLKRRRTDRGQQLAGVTFGKVLRA